MRKKILSGFVLAALLALLLLLCRQNVRLHGGTQAAESAAPDAAAETETVQPLQGNIIHAAGQLEGYVTTNALEALDAAFAAGARMIELDFGLTADGIPVCIHDWNENYLTNYEKSDFPLSLADFEASKIYDRFTPLTMATLADWLAVHEGVYIITDNKVENVRILDYAKTHYPAAAERMIPQIYAMEELEPVRELGFDRVILTVYLMDWETKTDAKALAEFAKKNDLAGITFPWELTEQEGYVKTLLKAGVPLFTHTVNDAAAIQAQLDMGITGVYTDCY